LHARVLEIVGQSPTPLSSREIEYQYSQKYSQRHLQLREKMSRSRYKHSDVYRVVNELAGFDTGKELLLGSWNALCSRKNQEYFKSSFVKSLNRLFNDPKHDNNNSYTFETYQHENKYNLDIESPNSEPSKWRFLKNKIVRIRFDSESKTGRFISDNYRLGLPLYIKHDKKNHDFKFYVRVSDTSKAVIINRIPFLQHILKDAAKEKISKLGGSTQVFHIHKLDQTASNLKISRDIYGYGKMEWNRSNEVVEIENNPRNFRYYLTLRGFLLFLLGSESNGISNSRISKVIKTLTENSYTKKDYPFLWNDHILDELQGRDFKAELLKRIAFETQHMLLREDDNFLRYWVTSQFHTAISRLYGGPGFTVLLTIIDSQKKNIKLDTVMKWIDEYDKGMLEYSLQYLQGEEADIKDLLERKTKKGQAFESELGN